MAGVPGEVVGRLMAEMSWSGGTLGVDIAAEAGSWLADWDDGAGRLGSGGT